MKQKQVIAIHDVSCIGKCSLTVALPILSAVGIETSVVPTAVLSTHTGGFTNYTYRDLTEDILPIAKHWKSLGIVPDAFYTGYLGSKDQAEIVMEVIDLLRSDETLIFVDPVMGDRGKLYSSFDEDFPPEMLKLCKKADMIIPNFTEAALLLNEAYDPGPYTEEIVCGLLRRLSALGPKKVFLTGVCFNEGEVGAAAYDRSTDTVSFSLYPRVSGYYHGTGDLFASELLGGIINGINTKDALDIAVKCTAKSIERTALAKTDVRYGVAFEQDIPEYIKMIDAAKKNIAEV